MRIQTSLEKKLNDWSSCQSVISSHIISDEPKKAFNFSNQNSYMQWYDELGN